MCVCLFSTTHPPIQHFKRESALWLYQIILSLMSGKSCDCCMIGGLKTNIVAHDLSIHLTCVCVFDLCLFYWHTCILFPLSTWFLHLFVCVWHPCAISHIFIQSCCSVPSARWIFLSWVFNWVSLLNSYKLSCIRAVILCFRYINDSGKYQL